MKIRKDIYKRPEVFELQNVKLDKNNQSENEFIIGKHNFKLNNYR
jgi:hypothetical protein